MSNKKTTLQTKSKQAKPAKTNIPTPPPSEEVVIETVEETKTPTVNPSQITTSNLVGTTSSALDANHRVELLHLADDIFRKDPNAEKRFTLEIREGMNQIIAAGVVSAIADEAQFGNSQFTAVMQSTMYPQLALVAHDMGIKLPDIKALPQGKEPGTVELPSTEIKPTSEVKKQMKEEHAIEVKGNKGDIELDPKKVAELDETALKDALSYILITGPKKNQKIKDTLTSTVDFMRDYRMALADKAEKPADVKDELDSRSVREWLNDAFSYVRPTALLSGIGRGMTQLIEVEKNAVSAFLILRQSLTDKDSNVPVWDDQSIADAVAAIVEFICNEEISKSKESIANLDTKHKDYKTVKASYEDNIAKHEKFIEYVTDPCFDIINDAISLAEADNAGVLKMFGRIRAQYYADIKNDDAADYKNLYENLAQRAGIIANMFRESGNKNQNYSEANLTELVKYTEEEKTQLRKDAAAAKKEESKNA